MVLDSQAARRSGGLGYSRSRKRRGPGRLIVIAVVVLVIGYFAWGYIFGSKPAATDTVDTTPVTAGDVPAKTEPAPVAVTHRPGYTETSKLVTPVPDVIDVKPPEVKPPPAPPTPAVNKPPVVAPLPPDSVEPVPVIRTGGEVGKQIESGRQLASQGQMLKAREVLSGALKGTINANDAELVRKELSEINQKLVFSPAVETGDPIAEVYVVQPGDSLVKIARPFNVPWQFVKDINHIADEKRMRLGARIKMIKGPFRVVVTKHEFRLDVWNGDLFIRSFPVGLGEFDSTPPGEWIVRAHSKLVNPPWVNPRNGQRFEADDPKNPLGRFWIGIRGTSPETEKFSGYGIHGTIAPESIGTMASMGCVRLLPDDIKLLYSMLEEEQSKVTILK